MTWLIIELKFMLKTIMNSQDWSHMVCSIMKMTQDNNITNRTGAVYAENEIELSQPIGLGAVYDENWTTKRRERSYRCDLCRKWIGILVTDRSRCGLWLKPDRTTTWLILSVWSTLKRKLNYHSRSGRVQSLMVNDTRQWCNWSYNCGITQKQNQTFEIDQARCSL